MERKGKCFQTYTGKAFYPLDPRPEDVCIEDIAHALSHICRYGGHCKVHYSVAQHSVLVARQGAHPYKNRFLLHDATEAYVGDCVRPLKADVHFGNKSFEEIEDELMKVICVALDLPPISEQIEAQIKTADNGILYAEARDLLKGGPNPEIWAHWDYKITHKDPIRPWSCLRSKEEFLCAYYNYKNGEEY